MIQSVPNGCAFFVIHNEIFVGNAKAQRSNIQTVLYYELNQISFYN